MRLENAHALVLLGAILLGPSCTRERDKPVTDIHVRWAFVNRDDCEANHIVTVEVRAHRSGNDTLNRRAPCADGSLVVPVANVPNIAGEWTVRVTALDASDQRDCFEEVEQRVTVVEKETAELRAAFHTNSNVQICEQFAPDIDGGPLWDAGDEQDAGGAHDAGGQDDGGEGEGECQGDAYDPELGCPEGYVHCEMDPGDLCYTFVLCGDCCDGMCVEQ